jgi:hypothetical protein
VKSTALSSMPSRRLNGSVDIFPLGVFLLGIAAIVVAAKTGNSSITLATAGIAILTILAQISIRFRDGDDVSFFLIVPTLISATQNVYLSLVSHEINSGELQAIVVINFVYALLLYTVLVAKAGQASEPARRQLYQRITLFFALIASYGVLTAVVFGSDPLSAIASARNVISPFLFLLIGLLASSWARLETYLRYLVWLGVGAIVFGFFERSLPNFWQDLGLAELWAKKGITTSAGTGLPSNFFASEQLDGEFIRRMAGPFADPVNFGTFLFSVFMAAWFLRSRFSTMVTLIGVVLAVSKGAFLGVLVWFAFWTRYFASRTNHILAIAVAATAGMVFYVFTLTSSTGSTTAHINGLLAGFIELPDHPLGRGLGGVGVLASLFSEGTESASEITESGIGMILGQLGLPGFTIYVLFFGTLTSYVLRIRATREKLLAAGLLAGFVLNAAFNEVALSPNSSATYFIAIGLILGRDLVGRDARVSRSRQRELDRKALPTRDSATLMNTRRAFL